MPETLRTRDCLLVFGLALAMRLVHLALVGGGPLFDVLIIDSAYYHERGVAIASGQGAGEQVFFMAPLYQYFLGGLYSVFGPHPLAAALLQAVGGAATAVLAAQLGTRLFDRRTGLAAGVIVALYTAQIFYDGALLTASVIQLLNVGALLLLVTGLAQGSRPDRLGRLAAAGALLGVSALARANVLLFLPLLLPAIGIARSSLRNALLPWAIVVLGTVGALLPATVRNAVVAGELVVTSANAGMNFYTGNHADAGGVYDPPEFLTSSEPVHERDDYLAEAGRRLGREVSPSEASRFWLSEGLDQIAAEPGAALSTVGQKLFMWLNRVEAPTNLSFYFARDHSPLLWLPLNFGILAPFGLLGLLLLRDRRFAILYAYLLAYLATCLVFFVSSEYRLPVVPILAVFGVQAARRLTDGWRGEGDLRRTATAATVGLVALFTVCNWETDGTRQLRSRRLDYLNFATAYTRLDELEKAETMLEASLAIDPDLMPAREKLAAIYRATGREAEAAALSAGLSLDALLARAHQALEAGDTTGAEVLYREVLTLDPPDPSRIWTRLGRCAELAGEPGEAADHYRRALLERPANLRARVGLARMLVDLDETEAARVELEAVLEKQPDHREARELLDELGD
ncbi:MAG TPA: tetratricopeptide repeat protein [Planctomycetota bacterium]|nr:tetratricopeptide repeat protein [Planctomycetota bacterium]